MHLNINPNYKVPQSKFNIAQPQFHNRMNPFPNQEKSKQTQSNQTQSNVKKNEKNTDEEIDLEYIVENKPKVNILREFMRANLKIIKSPEEILLESDK